MSRFITAADIARRDGHSNVRDWIMETMRLYCKKGYFTILWDGRRIGGTPLAAYVDFGRWLARCECNQSVYADPEEPIMFCPRCGNGNSGMARPVLFPPRKTRDEIEAMLMRRPVIEHPLAKNNIEKARLAKPIYPELPRNWHPSQSIESLNELNSIYGV